MSGGPVLIPFDLGDFQHLQRQLRAAGFWLHAYGLCQLLTAEQIGNLLGYAKDEHSFRQYWGRNHAWYGPPVAGTTDWRDVRFFVFTPLQAALVTLPGWQAGRSLELLWNSIEECCVPVGEPCGEGEPLVPIVSVMSCLRSHILPEDHAIGRGLASIIGITR